MFSELIKKDKRNPKYVAEALAVGLELLEHDEWSLDKLSKISKLKYHSCYRHFKHVTCGHSGVYTLSAVRKRQFKCLVCAFDRDVEAADRIGLDIVPICDKYDPSSKRHFKCRKCNTTRYLDTSRLRDGVFLCNTCKDSTFTRPSSVYLIRLIFDSASFLKLGMAENMNGRIKSYGLKEKFSFETLYVQQFKTWKEAQNFETLIHTSFKDYNLNETTSKKFMKNGFTECYPSELEDRILEVLNNKKESNGNI